MSNNSFALTATLGKKSLQVENCTSLLYKNILKLPVFLNASVLFVITEYLCKTAAEMLHQMAKYMIRQICKPIYPDLIQYNSANGEFLSLKNCFVLPWPQQHAKELVLLTVICMKKKVFMLRIHTFKQCFKCSGVQRPTSNTFFKSVGGFFTAKCSRRITKWVNNISLCVTFIFGTTPRW